MQSSVCCIISNFMTRLLLLWLRSTSHLSVVSSIDTQGEKVEVFLRRSVRLRRTLSEEKTIQCIRFASKLVKTLDTLKEVLADSFDSFANPTS